MTPDEMRQTIEDYVDEMEYGQTSDGFINLMRYINIDTLVGWFVESVCVNEVEEYLPADKAEAINEWYDKHCR